MVNTNYVWVTPETSRSTFEVTGLPRLFAAGRLTEGLGVMCLLGTLRKPLKETRPFTGKRAVMKH